MRDTLVYSSMRFGEISDSIVDGLIEKDPYSRIAAETLVTTAAILLITIGASMTST